MPTGAPLHCDAYPSSSASSSSPTKGGRFFSVEVSEPTEAEVAKWKKAFAQFATSDSIGGAAYLTEPDFVTAIAPAGDFAKITRQQYGTFRGILFRIADRSNSGKVTWEDFYSFEKLLTKPDADFDIAFKFFDTDGSGDVSFDEFKSTFSANLGPDAIPFDFDSSWVKLYLGKVGGKHVLGYSEFTQLMKGLQGERLRQGFAHFDKNQTGYIEPEDFQKIIYELARHKLSDAVLSDLPLLAAISPGGKISYSECIAFHNVVREMDMIEKIVREACARSPDGKITPSDFTNHASRAMRYGTFSPMEVAIIFHYAGHGDQKARLRLRDFAALLDPKWGPARPTVGATKPKSGTFLHETAKSLYYFGLGGIAGALGATFVYPIDVVKTRMQNQRSKVVGELLYNNSIDCFKKVYKNEGLFGFYRGLPPQLIGVAPEKAIKLTVNDLVRGYATNKETGRISVPWELLAGGAAGGCQVIFTNPLEIVKIRLQMQGQTAVPGAVRQGAGQIIKSLGLIGLYQGSIACLCRDVPFSAIYFPAYWHLKRDVFHEGRDGKVLGYGEALISAAAAGMPAAYLTTPADVIKTRLQTEARKGETHYKGVPDAFKKILAEEGPRALYKGGLARVFRSSPQFGVTLVAYENLKKLLPFPDPSTSITDLLPAQVEDISKVRARNALKVLLDVHEDFGGVRTKQ
ncbi:BQ2448_981 [Microbotryum intermedium]|uniref:Mitochondrial aspartate-glutamate transporter AGC1 n=1 Tax=Microbotryum intermedium TaxID=269621 RepID=A0A238F4E0_9BASI|nr:BQ2448_981 [Microbotryum intermedium]